jgi:hypothetical protein
VPNQLTISPVPPGHLRTDASQAPAGLACTVMEEIWEPVVGWEGLYEVSSLGRVRSISRTTKHSHGHRVVKGRILKPAIVSAGYPTIHLCLSGTVETAAVHTLVLEAFVGPRPEGMQCCHKDGSRTNNRLDNLRWDSVSRNNMDKVAHGTSMRGEKNPIAKLTEPYVLEILKSTDTIANLAKKYGVHRVTISKIKKGLLWSYLHEK